MKRSFFYLVLIFIATSLTCCQPAVLPSLPEGAPRAVFDASYSEHTFEHVLIESIDRVATTSPFSLTRYPSKTDLVPGPHILEISFKRDNLIPVGSITYFGKKELTVNAEAGKTYTVEWKPLYLGFFKGTDVEAKIIEYKPVALPQ